MLALQKSRVEVEVGELCIVDTLFDNLGKVASRYNKFDRENEYAVIKGGADD